MRPGDGLGWRVMKVGDVVGTEAAEGWRLMKADVVAGAPDAPDG